MYISRSLFATLLGTSALQLAATLAIPSLEKRIIGGFLMPDTMAPYSVSMLKTDGLQQFTCGGTIISPNFIVTAAHCVVSQANLQLPAANVTIGYGSMNKDKQKTIQAKGVYIHPQYLNGANRDVRYDIALVKVKTLKFNNFTSSIPIYNGAIGADQKLMAMGWGAAEVNAPNLNMLRGTIVTSGDPTTCQMYYPDFTDNNGPQICTLGNLNPGSSTCSGDSGSGVVASNNGIVMLGGFDSIGVFTVGSKCGDPNTAHFYIHVAYHLDFITKTTNITKEVLTNPAVTKPEAPKVPDEPTPPSDEEPSPPSNDKPSPSGDEPSPSGDEPAPSGDEPSPSLGDEPDEENGYISLIGHIKPPQVPGPVKPVLL
ncbi:Transmembrane protease serine 5 [Coemansia sp. 'formosensis']|nr:Transmembrane protease serine 5 [Coemansia sp. 'formosensis']